MALAAALLVVTVALLATQLVPEPVTALAFFAVATLTGAAPPAVLYGGFATTSLWLVAGGLLLAAAMQRTGLAQRLAAVAARRFAGSYTAALAGVVATGTLFAFLVPAAFGRVVILVPLVRALADAVGLSSDRPGRHGLMLAAVIGTMAPGFAILTANLPNLVLAGAAESLHGIRLGFFGYLLASFPVLGLLKLPLIVGLARWLFPDRLDRATVPEASTSPLSAAERRLVLLMLATVGLWATDALHGLPAGGVALTAGTLCLLPRVGFLEPHRLGRHLDLGTLLYVAAVLGLVGLVAHSGLAATVADALLARVELAGRSPAFVYAAIYALGSLVAVAAGFPIVAAVTAPMAPAIAEAAGLTTEAVLLASVAVFSMILLPHQEAPVAVGVRLGMVPMGRALGFMLALALLSTVLLAPLHFLWLRLLGLF